MNNKPSDPGKPSKIIVKEFLVNGPEVPSHLFIFAHGAGQGMATPFMETFATGIGECGIRVVRFHFPYMEQSLRSGQRRPPSGGGVLRRAFSDVINHCVNIEKWPRRKLIIGGKSMGGRMASMIADQHQVAGVVCVGYPFHPPRQPQRLRIEHLTTMKTPTLICQGERDRFGRREEVTKLNLSPAVRVRWIADGDHNFVPCKRSGRTVEQNRQDAIRFVCDFIRGL